jgi:hypothetical protein
VHWIKYLSDYSYSAYCSRLYAVAKHNIHNAALFVNVRRLGEMKMAKRKPADTLVKKAAPSLVTILNRVRSSCIWSRKIIAQHAARGRGVSPKLSCVSRLWLPCTSQPHHFHLSPCISVDSFRPGCSAVYQAEKYTGLWLLECPLNFSR